MPSATTSGRGPAPRFEAYSLPTTRTSSHSSKILRRKDTNVMKIIAEQENQGQKIKHSKQRGRHGNGLKGALSFDEQEKQCMLDSLWSRYAEMNRELEDSEAEVEDVKAEIQILNNELQASEFMKNVILSRMGQVMSTIQILETTPVL